VVFCVATFGAGVVAAQRLITCPKRQLQPERDLRRKSIQQVKDGKNQIFFIVGAFYHFCRFWHGHSPFLFNYYTIFERSRESHCALKLRHYILSKNDTDEQIAGLRKLLMFCTARTVKN
jgi:hypothetical protein